MSIKILALDMERTLIDNAMNSCPRPGLRDFLMFCHERFERVALFTSVETPDARDVLEGLVRTGHVPVAFLNRLEFIEWTGGHKALEFVPNATPNEVLLIDDDAGWVRADQRDRWIPIAAWDSGPDRELTRVRTVLEQWLVEN